MATPSLAPNPFTGASWGDSGTPPPNLLNPLPVGGANLNPLGFSNPKGSKELQQNIGATNLRQAQMKNFLIPQFAAQMGKFGAGAGDFFEQLKNLGSPYYRQKQTEAATAGTKAIQDTTGLSEQELASKGYGYTPSGANAAMIGGEAVAGAQSLAEQYLQNLFQNEQLQLAGAQGEQALAQLFNPAQLFSTVGTGMSQSTTSPSFFQNLEGTLRGIGSALTGGAAANASRSQ